MFTFLDSIPAAVLRDLVKSRVPTLHDGVDRLNRDRLYDVLFSLFGFDVLEERDIRRQLLLTLPLAELRRIAEEFRLDSDGKPFDLAVQVANRGWKTGGPGPRMFANEFGVAAEFLPGRRDRDPAVEVVEPFAPPLPLFDYQSESVSSLVRHLAAGRGVACLLQLPTGAGKTRVAMEALSQFLRRKELEQRDFGMLWMAHSEELCDQAAEAFQRAWISTGTFNVRLVRFWGSYHCTPDALVGAFVVASYQKVVGLVSTAPSDFAAVARRLSVVVVDEAHKALAPTIKTLLDSIRRCSGAKIVGLTATPGRGKDATSENRQLAALFDRRLVRPTSLGRDPVAELQRRGILARVHRAPIESGIRLRLTSQADAVATGADEVPAKVLASLAGNERRNRLIVDSVGQQVARGRPTLVFCCSVAHAKKLAVMAAGLGARAASIDCFMPRGRRRRLVAAFRAGRVDALFNFGVLSTGFDSPNICCVVIARPTSSIVLYSQMIGRGLRGPAVGGTEEFELVDVMDHLENFGGVSEVYGHFERYWAS